MAGNKLEGIINGGVKNSDYILPQGDNFPEMIEVVRKLARQFQFVRVDLYMANNNIYFGELTFTDGAGSDPFGKAKPAVCERPLCGTFTIELLEV